MGNPDERDQWGNKLDFILSCLGYAVGLGNVWRFPYLCGRNGGGVFLIPYGIMLIFAGFPTFYLELSIGQYAALTPHLLYRRMSPLFAGIGYSMVAISMYTGVYYNVIIAWSMRYLFASFTSDLPFIGCHHEWNNMSCYDATVQCNETFPFQVLGQCREATFQLNFTKIDLNNPDFAVLQSAQDVNTMLTDPTNDFSQSSSKQYNDYVLGTRLFHEGIGYPKWDLVIALAVSWVMVFLALCKGVKSSGKVVYFTATFPYLLLLILLIRGVLLDGAGEGIKYFLTGTDTLSEMEQTTCDFCAEEANALTTRCWANVTEFCLSPFVKLKTSNVWKDAAQQIFFSLSLGGGGLTTLASYNQFNNNLLRDTLIVVVGNCATSIFAGFVIFPIIGYVANITQRKVSHVAASGTALAFIVYPEGLARLSPPWLWSILFFFMLILLGIDSQLVIVEVVITAIIDQWPALRRTAYKVTVVAVVCLISFGVGLIFTIPQGKYILTIVDSYAGGIPLVICCLVEVFMVAWVYGVWRFLGDIRLMMGSPPNCCWSALGYPVNPYWWINWTFITPCLLFGVLVFMVIGWEPTEDGGYILPWYMDLIGWVILVTCCIWIPLLALIQMVVHVVFRRDVNWGPLLNSTPEWRPAIETADKNTFALSPMNNETNGTPTHYGHQRQESHGYSQYTETDEGHGGYGDRVHPKY